MSFFAHEPVPPKPPSPQLPWWFAPPANELGAPVPVRRLLVRTDKLALSLVDVVAYSTGFSFRLVLRVHPDAAADIDSDQLFRELLGFPMDTSEDRMRFGVAFGDGRKATREGQRGSLPDEPPSIYLARQAGGSTGNNAWESGYWVYPLPPTGALTVALAWPARDIPEQTHSLDATPIVAAAAESIVLWDDDRPT